MYWPQNKLAQRRERFSEDWTLTSTPFPNYDMCFQFPLSFFYHLLVLSRFSSLFMSSFISYSSATLNVSSLSTFSEQLLMLVDTSVRTVMQVKRFDRKDNSVVRSFAPTKTKRKCRLVRQRFELQKVRIRRVWNHYIHGAYYFLVFIRDPGVTK